MSVILNDETVEMDTIVGYKRQGKKVIIGDLVRAIEVNTPSGGKGYFYRKDGNYIMEHGGTAEIGEYDTLTTAFQEYTRDMQKEREEIVKTLGVWESGVAYSVGDIRDYQNHLYKCIQAHTSQDDWTPDVTPSLWKKISDPGTEWPEWVQPTGAHDAYSLGDKVSHNEKHWVSTCNSNVWEPGVYGWEEVTE